MVFVNAHTFARIGGILPVNCIKLRKFYRGNGIYGKISEVKENTFIVEIAPGVCIEVAKSGVAEVIEQQEAGK